MTTDVDELGQPTALLLLDEPTAACDEKTAILVENTLIKSNVTMLIITHDSSQLKRIAHRNIYIK